MPGRCRITQVVVRRMTSSLLEHRLMSVHGLRGFARIPPQHWNWSREENTRQAMSATERVASAASLSCSAFHGLGSVLSTLAVFTCHGRDTSSIRCTVTLEKHAVLTVSKRGLLLTGRGVEGKKQCMESSVNQPRRSLISRLE